MATCAVLLLLVAVATSHAAVPASRIAEKLNLCARNRDDFESCMRDRLQVLLPQVGREGLPELEVPPLESFQIPEMSIQYRNDNWSSNIQIKNIKSMGIRHGLDIKAVRADINDPKRFHFEVDFSMPRVYVEGNYKVDAKLLLPLYTKGYFNVSMTDVSGTWNVTGEHFLKGGKDYVRITNFSMLPEVGDMKVYVSNLFPGNEELSNAAVDFANQFWPFIYKELLPFTDQAWGTFTRNELNRLFLRVPFDQMFPEA